MEGDVVGCGTTSTHGIRCGGLNGCPIKIRDASRLQMVMKAEEGMAEEEEASTTEGGAAASS